jgi:hypothetical protein
MEKNLSTKKMPKKSEVAYTIETLANRVIHSYTQECTYPDGRKKIKNAMQISEIGSNAHVHYEYNIISFAENKSTMKLYFQDKAKTIFLNMQTMFKKNEKK